METQILVVFVRDIDDTVPPTDEFTTLAENLARGDTRQFTQFDVVEALDREEVADADHLPTPTNGTSVFTDEDTITEAVEWAWDTTAHQVTTHIQTLRETLPQLDDDEILAGPSGPLTVSSDSPPVERLRHAAHRLAGAESPTYRLYDEYGDTLHTRSQVDKLLDYVTSTDNTREYLVPMFAYGP